MTEHPGAGSQPEPLQLPTDVRTDVRTEVRIEVVDAVAAAVLGVPGVVGLHGGAFGEAATYLPGRSVPGVQLRPGNTIVHVVLAWGIPVQQTADRVRTAVTDITHTRVDVVVEDVAAPRTTVPGDA